MLFGCLDVVRLGAAVKDAENKSHTVLARSLLSAFYHKDDLIKTSVSSIRILLKLVLILQMMIVSLKIH